MEYNRERYTLNGELHLASDIHRVTEASWFEAETFTKDIQLLVLQLTEANFPDFLKLINKLNCMFIRHLRIGTCSARISHACIVEVLSRFRIDTLDLLCTEIHYDDVVALATLNVRRLDVLIKILLITVGGTHPRCRGVFESLVIYSDTDLSSSTDELNEALVRMSPNLTEITVHLKSNETHALSFLYHLVLVERLRKVHVHITNEVTERQYSRVLDIVDACKGLTHFTFSGGVTDSYRYYGVLNAAARLPNVESLRVSTRRIKKNETPIRIPALHVSDNLKSVYLSTDGTDEYSFTLVSARILTWLAALPALETLHLDWWAPADRFVIDMTPQSFSKLAALTISQPVLHDTLFSYAGQILASPLLKDLKYTRVMYTYTHTTPIVSPIERLTLDHLQHCSARSTASILANITRPGLVTHLTLGTVEVIDLKDDDLFISALERFTNITRFELYNVKVNYRNCLARLEGHTLTFCQRVSRVIAQWQALTRLRWNCGFNCRTMDFLAQMATDLPNLQTFDIGDIERGQSTVCRKMRDLIRSHSAIKDMGGNIWAIGPLADIRK